MEVPRRVGLVRFLRKLLLFVAALLVPLLVLEGALRLFWTRPPRVGDRLPIHAVDQRLGWRARPLVSIVHRFRWGDDVTIKTNSRGFRDVEHEVEPTPGVPRVVVLGDSFVFGYGVNNGEIFTDRLREIAPTIECINLGVTAYSVGQERLLLESDGLAYRPDVVLVAYCQNDYDASDLATVRSMTTDAPAVRRRPSGPREFLSEHSYLFDCAGHAISGNKSLSRLLVAIGVKGDPGGLQELAAPLRPFVTPEPPEMAEAWRRVSEELAAMKRACDASGAKLLVVAVPVRETVQPARLDGALAYVDYDAGDFDLDQGYRRLEAIAREQGIELLDPCPAFRASAEELYLPFDMHFNATGHRVFAGAIAARLEGLVGR